MIPVVEITSVDQLRAHYRGVSARRERAAPPQKQAPPVVVDVVHDDEQKDIVPDMKGALEIARSEAGPRPDLFFRGVASDAYAAIRAIGRHPPSLRFIVACVCDHTGVASNEFISQRRMAKIVLARQMYYWVARKLTAGSYPQIAKMAGNRDHSTALYGVAKVQAMYDADAEFRSDLDGLEKRISATWDYFKQ